MLYNKVGAHLYLGHYSWWPNRSERNLSNLLEGVFFTSPSTCHARSTPSPKSNTATKMCLEKLCQSRYDENVIFPTLVPHTAKILCVGFLKSYNTTITAVKMPEEVGCNVWASKCSQICLVATRFIRPTSDTTKICHTELFCLRGGWNQPHSKN